MKKFAGMLNYLLHPLVVPTLGMLIILNSGSYLSLMNPEIKRALLMIMALGTLVFPGLMILFSRYRNISASRQSQRVSLLTILVLYLITMIYFLRLPVNHVLHTFVVAIVVVLALLLLAGTRFQLSMHGAASGSLVALLISLMLLFETPLQGMLVLVLLAGGLSGSIEIYLKRHRPREVFRAWVLGFTGVMATFLIY